MSLVFLVCIELLRRRSNRNNGLKFYTTSDDIPTSVFIAYTYAPAILATVFSILWSIVDLDAKRMEPFHQISDRRCRVFPLSLLFLDYAFSSTWKVPFRACKRRHWTIAVTSLVFLMSSVFLVPIQSALFGLKPASISSTLAVDAWPNLPTLKDQGQLFTGETVNQASSIVSKKAGLPPFTTEDYAVSPLRLMTEQEGINETWTILSRVYWSEPSCLDLPDYHVSSEPESTTYEPPNSTILHWMVSNVTIPTEAANSSSCRLVRHDVVIKRPQKVAASYPTWDRYNKQRNGIDVTGDAYDQHNCTKFPFMASLYALNPNQNGIDPKDVSYNTNAIAVTCRSNYFSGIGKVSVLRNGSIASVSISEEHQPESLDNLLARH